MNWEDKIGGMLFDYEEDTISQEEIIDAIKSLLKKQRESCVERIYNTDRICKKDDLCEQCRETVDLILNTPEPE